MLPIISLLRPQLPIIFIGWIFVCMTVGAAFAQTTAFTYQGSLTDAGGPANGSFQMQFKLYDAVSGGVQVGSTIADIPVTTTHGVFTTRLDFGSNALSGANRWLEIAVRHNSGEGYTTLSPREQIASAPYAVRTLSAALADIALDSNKLGGVDASEYVTTTNAGNTFIKNATALQPTSNFNISGNGIVGGTLGVGNMPFPGFKLDVSGDTLIRTSGSGGDIQLGTPSAETGLSIVKTNRADLRFDNANLKLVVGTGTGIPSTANGITINTSGNVGIGITPFPGIKLDVNGDTLIRTSGSGGNIQFGTPSAETGLSMVSTNRADFRFNNSTLKLVVGTGTGVPSAANGLNINTSGNVGIGSATPNTRLTLNGGPTWTSNGWTASMNLQNSSAFGWEANASGQRFGIGQSTGGLYFFRTNSAFGNTANPANYDLAIQDDGNITQNRGKAGLVKAMVFVDSLGTIIRCYNGITNSSTGNCGFGISHPFNSALYEINFGFLVDDRFVSVTAHTSDGLINVGATFRFRSDVGLPNTVRVETFITDVSWIDSHQPNPFMIIVY